MERSENRQRKSKSKAARRGYSGDPSIRWKWHHILLDRLSFEGEHEWKSKVGTNTSVEWPAGVGGKGNDGVAGLLKQQEGAIGYVELIYAVKNQLPYGRVKNKSGEFVKAELKSVTAAATAMKEMPADFRVSITDGAGAGVYPISTFTWLLVPAKYSDSGKAQAVKGFLKWAITQGQEQVESLEYAKLPKTVVAQEEKQIARIQ